MVKDAELKKRAIYVYPPKYMADRWKATAKDENMSISKFIIKHVDNSINQDSPNQKTKLDLIQENQILLERLREKERRIDQLDMLVDKLDRDIKRMHARQFTDDNFTGIRSYDKLIIDILKEPGIHPIEDLFSRLRISPQNTESVKALSKQLENLELYGLIKATSQGYVWVE